MIFVSKSPLSTGALKLIAMFFMTVDHIGAYLLPQVVFLRILGRIAAPLFLFCITEGLRHTRNRQKYLLRLYLSGAVIGLFDVFLLHFGAPFPRFSNILFTFFYTGLYITLLDKLLQKNYLALLGVLATLLPIAVLNLYDALFAPGLVRNILATLLPSPLYVSYSWLFILLGVGLYFAKEHRRQILVYTAFCAVCILGTQLGLGKMKGYFTLLFPKSIFSPIQGYMFLALPFLALYNGKKGPGNKWLFYIYYPLHRYVLCLLAAIVG